MGAMSKSTESRPSSAERRAARKQAAIARKQRERRRNLMIGGAVLAIAIVALLIFVNRPDDNDAVEIDFASIPSNGTVLGNSAATVQIVEYADYQCPFCAQFASDVFPQIVSDFVEPGLVTYQFQVFPFLGGDDLTNPDNESVQAAEASMCALDQGKFWEYNELLFERHDGENQGAFANDNLKAFAGELGLDTATFNTCLDSGQHQQEVLDQFASDSAAGIDSTPTIFINGQSIPYTTQGYSLLKRQIEAAIAGETIPLS
jgi:protein-disulfide isomerase